jgi:hypothetical protein
MQEPAKNWRLWAVIWFEQLRIVTLYQNRLLGLNNWGSWLYIKTGYLIVLNRKSQFCIRTGYVITLEPWRGWILRSILITASGRFLFLNNSHPFNARRAKLFELYCVEVGAAFQNENIGLGLLPQKKYIHSALFCCILPLIIISRRSEFNRLSAKVVTDTYK